MSEHFARLASALSPRYRLERPIDRGGAAHVYLAEDRLRGRRVAVKVLHEELAASVSADRFMAEISVSARLPHPSIVPVYDSGDVDGLPYFVMPFIDGESLRARLAREGRLSLADALQITEDIARAVDFAHRRNVVHRDIKPGNVMLYRGRAMLLDFGIALALDSMDMHRRTSPGLTLGTVEYMSPEQAGGERRIDGRSDIYSLACVMHEMVCGRPPFTGAPITVMNQHATTTPRALIANSPGVPLAVSHVLCRALAKAPAERFATAGEFLAALWSAAPKGGPAPRRVGVLSFVHLRHTPAVDAFSDRVTQEVIYALRNLEGVRIAAGSSVPYTDGKLHIARIGRELDAEVLLLGSVREGRGSVRLAATLLDARTGSQLWSGRLTGRLCDEFEPDCGLAGDLARAVGAVLETTDRSDATRAFGGAPSRNGAGRFTHR